MSRENEKHIDGNEWLAGQLSLLKESRSEDDIPHGTFLPKWRTWHDIHRTLVFPFRHCVDGDSLHVLKWPMFQAADDFSGSFLIASGLNRTAAKQKARGVYPTSNGNFGTHYRNLFLDCRLKAGGISFRGAQCSSVENVCIRHAGTNPLNPDIDDADGYPALQLENGTCRTRLTDLDVENGEPKTWDLARQRVGEGIVLRQVKGVVGSNISLHCINNAIRLVKSHGVRLLGVQLEKCNHVHVDGTNNLIEITDWQWASDTPFVFGPADHGGNVIRGKISKTSGQLYYIDPKGFKRKLFNKASTHEGRSFELRTTWQPRTIGWGRVWKLEIELFN